MFNMNLVFACLRIWSVTRGSGLCHFSGWYIPLTITSAVILDGLWPSLWLAPLLWVAYSTQFYQSSLSWMVLLISMSCTRADALDGNSSTGSRSSLWLVSSLSGWPVPPLLPIQTSWMVLLPGSHTGTRFGHRPSSRWNQSGPVQLPAQQPKLQYLQQRHTPLTSGVVVMGSALLDEGFARLFNMVCPSWA